RAVAGRERRDDARAREADVDVEAEPAQLRRDERRRALLVVRELGMRVQVAPPSRQLIAPGVDLRETAGRAVHERHSSPAVTRGRPPGRTGLAPRAGLRRPPPARARRA